MNQQLDKFFRDKLADFSKAAPTTTWDKLEAGLDKKTDKSLWWKVAASLSFITVGGYMLWLMAQHNAVTPSTISHNQQSNPPLPPKTETAVVIKINPTEVIVSDKKRKKPRIEKKQLHDVKKTKADVPSSNLVISDPTLQPLTEVIPSSIEGEVENNLILLEKQEEVIAVHEAVIPPSENMTLIFRANETDDYLTKNILTDATTEVKKRSTFKKLLKKAKDLKTNQDPFGELRQKKNEILALNFKNDKRGQNK